MTKTISFVSIFILVLSCISGSVRCEDVVVTQPPITSLPPPIATDDIIVPLLPRHLPHISGLSKEAQDMVITQLFSLIMGMPHDNLQLEKITSATERKYLDETGIMWQYRAGYVDGWKIPLRNFDVSVISKILWRGNTKATRLDNGTIEFSPIVPPKIHFSYPSHVVIDSNTYPYYALGQMEGRRSIEPLIDKALRKGINASLQWIEEDTQRLLSGKDISEIDKRKRIRAVPEIEALLYLLLFINEPDQNYLSDWKSLLSEMEDKREDDIK